MSRARVLAVDDERFFREAIGDALAQDDVEIVTAATGGEALAMAEDPMIGAVVLDLQLPDMHGLDVFRKLKADRPDVRVVILSAHTDQDNVLEALRLGAFDYLAKPLHEEELRLAVRRALDTHDIHAGRGRLRDRLARLDRQVEALRRTTNEEAALGGEERLQSLRQWAVDAIADVLGASKTSLMLLDDAGSELRVAAVRGRKVEALQMDGVPVGAGVAGQVLARGESIVVTDLEADGRFAIDEREGRYDTGSFAVAPLGVGSRALGVLCAADPVDGGRFDDEDLAWLRILGAHLAQVLDPFAAASEDAPAAGQVAASDPRAAEIARAVCDAVTAEVEPERVLAAALRPIGEILRAAPVSVFLLDARGELVREAEWDGGHRTDRDSLPVGGIAGALLEGAPLVATGDAAQHPRFDAAVDTPADGEAGALVCAPLQFRGKVLGIVRAFPESAEDAAPELAEVTSAALSAAVRNVLLYRSLVATIDEVAEARRGRP